MRFNSKWLLLAGIFLLFLFSFSPYHTLMVNKLMDDDASYLAHAFTLGLDFNLNYKDMVANWTTQNGKIAAHPIGPGLLAAPFVAFFSLFDRLSHHAVIENHGYYQYSWSYFGFIFASIFYYVSGLVLYAMSLRCLKIKLPPVNFILLTTTFGILFYVLYRPVMGHSFEFFTIALCFLSSIKLCQRTSYGWGLLCALSIVLSLVIRPANINVILLPFIIMLFHKQDWKKLKSTFFILVLGCLVAYLPFGLLNLKLYDKWYPSFVSIYGNALNPIPPIHNITDFISALVFLSTHAWQILLIFFSSEFGIAFTSATLFFGMGFFLLKIRSLFLLMLTLAYVGLPITIIIFWQTVGDAYAYRFLFCLFPLALLGYAQVWIDHKYIFAQKLMLGFCVFSLMCNLFFGLSSDLIYTDKQKSAFGKVGGNAMGYNINVAKATLDPSMWLRLCIMRTPGFIAFNVLENAGIEPEIKSFPSLQEKIEKFKTQNPVIPFRIYIQIVLLGLLFITGVYASVKRLEEMSSR